MSTRRRLSALTKQTIKQRFAATEEADSTSSSVDYFAGWEESDYPLFLDSDFDPLEAWWMAELCRLIYTPDSKEFTRIWHANKPDRNEILEERTPFHELLDVHKTGHHASIYEIKDGGTVLCFRGTSKPGQWISNLVFHPHEWSRFRDPDNPETEGGYVHSGFYVVFKRIWPLIWPTLRLAKRPWIFTGHSMGGALAMIANAVAGADKVFTFGSPRPGNGTFARISSENTFRIVNQQDIVPLLPTKDRNMGDKEFYHGGQCLWIKEPGALADDITEHSGNQPWKLLEDWAKSSESLTSLPPWIRHHYAGEYCKELRKIQNS